MATFGYKFGLLPPVVSDVATREVTVTVNGIDPPTKREFPGTAVITDEFVFNLNDNVAVTAVDIDGSGNRSESSAALTFVVTDDVPPPAPGLITIAEHRQID
jgi:hypothetical protein